MQRNKRVGSNIKTNHTYEEYSHFFGRRLKKGKLFDYSLDQKHLLNPDRQYWLLKDKDGKEAYYELPYNIHPTKEFKRFSIRRIFASKAFITTASIVCLLGIGAASLSIYAATKSRLLPFPPEYDADDDEILIKFNDCIKFGVNPLSIFSIQECGRIPIIKFNKGLFSSNTSKPYFTVGYGTNESHPIPGLIDVNVEISNSLIFDGIDEYEESVYYGDSFAAPKKGNRDYNRQSRKWDKPVRQYVASSNPDRTCKYDPNNFNKYTVSEYVGKAGKHIKNPFLYVITSKTILTDKNPYYPDPAHPDPAKVQKGSTMPVPIYENSKLIGYNIHLELHPNLSVTAEGNCYVKRIEYLSNFSVKNFNFVTFDMVVDKEFNLIESRVNEDYVVNALGMEVLTHGKFHTKYYSNNVPQIPEPDVAFDYSKYPINKN